MVYGQRHYRWDWRLRATPEQLWPYVADTNRFNRDAGLPAVRPGSPATGADAHRRLGFRRFGLRVEWDEEPFEWLRPQRFGVMRRYRAGPLATMRVLVELSALPRGGTRLRYETWVRPASQPGLLAIPVVMWQSRRAFGFAFREYDRRALRPRPPDQRSASVELAPGASGRLRAVRRTLTDRAYRPELVERLLATVERGDEFDLAHLRAYALADAWGAPRRELLGLCLEATRAGLLDLQWDVMCPLCRGSKQSADRLADLQERVHCEVCNLDIAVNFERSVELTFRPNAAVRRLDLGLYCVGGPQVTPHIVAQQLLRPGEQRTLTPLLEPGRYRVRTLALPGGQFLNIRPGSPAETALVARASGWPDEELQLAPAPQLRLANATAGEQVFILERMAWTDQATTAAEATSLQLFRDLFSREVLRPGQQISVGSLTVLFTDLRDSTGLYRQIGDAPAFGRVLDHFAVLRECVSDEDGAMVKTIGDAIMAVFPRPLGAVRAVLAAQQRLAAPPDGILPLHLKAGIHLGPCLAVTLNDRLDYFGSVVNLASRLERFSSGADVILSDAVYADPEVAEFLGGAKGAGALESFEAPLKGFGDQQFRLWRVARTAEE